MPKDQLPDLDDLHDLLLRADIIMSASEAHGMLCGMVSAQERLAVVDWLSAIGDKPDQPNCFSSDEEVLLKQFVKASRTQIESEDYNFQLLLPDDDSDINLRTVALGEWCQGFVAGLGLSGCYINEKANNESSEALRDLCEISKVTAEMVGTEEEERAFVEVVEYVRVAVLLIYRSLCFDREQHEAPAELLH